MLVPPVRRTGVNDIRAATMTRKVLLTGRPGCGKTTLIRRVVNELARPAGGFYTEEIRERGARVGFKIVTLAGEETVLSHVDFKTANRIGKYGLDLSGLETIGVAALRRAVAARQLSECERVLASLSPCACQLKDGWHSAIRCRLCST